MPFPSAHQPVVTLSLGDEEFELLFDFETVARAEDLTGIALITGMTRETAERPRVNFARAMLFACLLPRQKKMTFELASKMVTKESLTDVWNTVLEAYFKAMSPGKDGPQEENPQTAHS